MVLLKIPIVGLFLIVRWAVRQTPDMAGGAEGGGIGARPWAVHPHPPHAWPPAGPPPGPPRRSRLRACAPRWPTSTCLATEPFRAASRDKPRRLRIIGGVHPTQRIGDCR